MPGFRLVLDPCFHRNSSDPDIDRDLNWRYHFDLLIAAFGFSSGNRIK
jgi:hypothetical protein